MASKLQPTGSFAAIDFACVLHINGLGDGFGGGFGVGLGWVLLEVRLGESWMGGVWLRGASGWVLEGRVWLRGAGVWWGGAISKWNGQGVVSKSLLCLGRTGDH